MGADVKSRVYCSELARAAGDDPAGTMGRIDLWVLLEVARPWQARVLEDNELPAKVQAWLTGIEATVLDATGLVARVLFVKQRTSTDLPGVTLSLAFAGEQTSRLYRYELPRYQDLAALDLGAVAAAVQADMLAQAVADGQAPSLALVPEGAMLVDTVMVLVCTNGKRDLCCARFGLPLFEALATEFGEQVWQTSHIGGHRYAPNMVCLPQGTVYGFVAPERGVDILRQELAGELSLDHLRGRSCHDQGVQACEVHLRRALGLSERGAVELLSHSGSDSQVEALFQTPGKLCYQVLMTARSERQRASCAAAGDKDVMVWELQAVAAQ